MLIKKYCLVVLLFISPALWALDAPSSDQQQLEGEKKRSAKVKDSIVGSNKEQDFSLYRLNYAILNDEDLMLQYSFKYRIIDELYLAYTNLVLWDIYHEHLPAEDNNFMPEAFYRLMLDKGPLVSVDAGWFHRSNGEQGEVSRAWDRWQVRFNTMFEPGGKQLLWTSTVFSDLKKSKNNKDINDYIGPWEMNFTLRNAIDWKNNELDIGFKLVPGDGWLDFERGQRVIGLHYRQPFKAFKPTIFAQYFWGYSEVIRYYNREREAFRLGLSFHY
ncbi:phospholipase A [Agaribacterium haliotis]|uniref:phospholipase A n=1 Tax=Agaribacterium haliotis TaxID=2013869 RepID=UPI000BB53239|nr:phospholipase A [Agaribacterium haliotis]